MAVRKTIKKTTIYDIAQKAGVSAAAVSMALNNRPGVGEETRLRILDLARKSHYYPDFVAKTLVTKRSRTIGVVINSIADPFFTELSNEIELGLDKKGYNMILCNAGGVRKKERRHIDMLMAKGVDGIIITTVAAHDAYLNQLTEARFPIVCLNRIPIFPNIDPELDYVVMDNAMGGYLGVRHLWRLGHDRIAVISGDVDASNSIANLEGIEAFLKEKGAGLSDDCFAICNYSRDLAFQATRTIMEKADPLPTAFLVLDDNMALGVREALLAQDCTIPEDIAVVSFDDTKISALSGIELTTVGQKIPSQMGQLGVELLLDKIEGRIFNNSKQIQLEPELIIRTSCGFHKTGYVR